jgi:hypothetical protein
MACAGTLPGAYGALLWEAAKLARDEAFANSLSLQQAAQDCAHQVQQDSRWQLLDARQVINLDDIARNAERHQERIRSWKPQKLFALLHKQRSDLLPFRRQRRDNRHSCRHGAPDRPIFGHVQERSLAFVEAGSLQVCRDHRYGTMAEAVLSLSDRYEFGCLHRFARVCVVPLG